MRPVFTSCLILFIAIASLTSARAQTAVQKDTLYLIETSDGNDYIGNIVREDSTHLVLATADLGQIRIPLSNITRRTPVTEDRLVGKEVWLENPQAARYFYAPNGYGLHQGEWYYQNIWVLFNQMSVGITDHISLGVGMVPLFLFDGAPTPIWITPKVSIPVVKDQLNLGVGALAGTIGLMPDAEGGNGFGIVYGVATVGSKDRNASVGVGYGYIDGELADSPSINFSAMVRGGRKFYFVTENYFFTGSELGLMSAGGRSMIRNASIDYGLVVPLNAGVIIGIPWLGFAVPFYAK